MKSCLHQRITFSIGSFPRDISCNLWLCRNRKNKFAYSPFIYLSHFRMQTDKSRTPWMHYKALTAVIYILLTPMYIFAVCVLNFGKCFRRQILPFLGCSQCVLANSARDFNLANSIMHISQKTSDFWMKPFCHLKCIASNPESLQVWACNYNHSCRFLRCSLSKYQISIGLKVL